MKTENITIGTEYPLGGILTLPGHLTEKVPAVVLVHGSGPADRDESIMKLKPFRDLAEGLAARGIASVRYDKRTYKYGRRMVKKGDITVRAETIEDAVTASGLLKSDPRIDPEKVFIIGHSMGGMLAPRIDAEGGNFRGLILMAGSPRRLEEILVEQMSEIRDDSGFIVRRIIGKQVENYEKQFRNLYSMPAEEAKKTKFGNGTTLYYFREMGEHPASGYLLNTDKPILIMQGEKDFQTKKDVDYAAYRELLKDRENVTFRLYENLNHLFMPSVYGKIKEASREYKKEQHVQENVMDDISEWISSVC